MQTLLAFILAATERGGSAVSKQTHADRRNRPFSVTQDFRSRIVLSVAPGKALDARLQQLGKSRRRKIYPPMGRTADEVHDFPFIGVSIWEPEVFTFLDENMQK